MSASSVGQMWPCADKYYKDSHSVACDMTSTIISDSGPAKISRLGPQITDHCVFFSV